MNRLAAMFCDRLKPKVAVAPPTGSQVPLRPDSIRLCCPTCRRPLHPDMAGDLTCRECGFSFPVVLGIPVLVSGAHISRADEPSEEAVRAVCSAFNVGADQEARDFVSKSLSTQYRYPDWSLEAENNYLLSRLNISESREREILPPASGGDNPTLELVRHYIGSELPADVLISHNVRFRNVGKLPIFKTKESGLHLTGSWLTAKGDLVQPKGYPSRFPVTIPPNTEGTVPVWMRTPKHPGSFLLSLGISSADSAPLPSTGWQIPVSIKKKIVPSYKAFSPEVKPKLPDYDEDHREAIRILERAVTKYGAKVGLELGGSASPMTTNLPCSIMNTDIDAQALQVGNFVFGRRGHANVKFLCCDSHHLPFEDGVFDFAAVFSALHHYSDPLSVLRSAVRVVKREGFLAVMCEPTGHYFEEPDEEMQGALENGINEQRFSFGEYQRLFHDAGLRIESAQLNADSLKTILVRT